MNLQNQKASILIVDDDPNVLNMLELGLQSEFNVVAIFQPEKAMDVFGAGDFDLVITDIVMPYVSGFEILRKVKEANELIEVILLTGELPDKAKPAVTSLQKGAHDYLLKPVKLLELKAAILKAFEKQKLRLENKRLLLELVRMANTDCLTGLSTRRHFYSQLYQEFERSDRYSRSLGCLFLDIDKFKEVNDNYGHLRGDSVLERVGKLLINHSRGSDMKCRFGGDEFVLVLPEANLEKAIAMAEKLRGLIEKEAYDFADPPLNLTASVGVASCEMKNFQTADELLSAADLALLSAKREGGNCIRCSNGTANLGSSVPALSSS
jgi:two-component system cell cycle response regulator